MRHSPEGAPPPNEGGVDHQHRGAEAEEGQVPQIILVQEIKDEEVVINGNHPLAGVVLHFDISVEEVREATEEEIAHGHVHGEGGHAH